MTGSPSSPEQVAEFARQWLKTAGEQVERLQRELAARDERILHLEQMLEESEARRHESELARVSLTADLLVAGDRIIELESRLKAR